MGQPEIIESFLNFTSMKEADELLATLSPEEVLAVLKGIIKLLVADNQVYQSQIASANNFGYTVKNGTPAGDN